MATMIIEMKDDKFLISITPYLENTFVIEEIKISEEAFNAINKKQNNKSPVKEFVEQWGKIFRE
ncbi:hypothetical protein V4D30_00925 [Thermodesulfovibrio sp. 3907-1M]|jgi:hypothetical protein|uniref:Uncharacterized protein n=1 Tax=Thermodesulfovibrio autotrophicus TaxID=3118333 RepID=A0AAU8GWR0_9BACT